MFGIVLIKKKNIPAWYCDVNVIVKVNVACALRWGAAFVGITLLGMAHPIWDNILGTRNFLVEGSHPEPRE